MTSENQKLRCRTCDGKGIVQTYRSDAAVCPSCEGSGESVTAPIGVASKELLCCVGASLPSQKFGAWIVDEIRGTRVRLVSGNLKADKWLSLEVVESMLQLVKQHNVKSSHSRD